MDTADPPEAGLRIRRWILEVMAGLGLVALGLLIASMASALPASDEPGVPGPGTAPYLLGLVIAASGGALGLIALIKRPASLVGLGGARHLAALLALGMSAYFFETGGFVLVTFVFLVFTFVLLGDAPWRKAAPAAAIAALGLWLIFTKLLGVGLPYGLIGEILFR